VCIVFFFSCVLSNVNVDSIEKLKAACSSCGRPSNPAPITLKSIFSDGLSVIFNLEKGFLFTIKELLLRPGEALNNYLSGEKRYLYYNPFRFAFIAVTLSFIIFQSLGFFEATIALAAPEGQNPEDIKESMTFLEKYGPLLTLTLVPFVSLGSWILFRRINFAEHLVANFFAYGQISLLGILLVPLYYFINELLLFQQLISMIMILVYTTFFFRSYFKGNWIVAFLKVLAAVIIGIVLLTLLATVVGFLFKALQEA